jgi:CheY-like chemotaxis protein
MDNIQKERQRSILLLPPCKEMGENLIRWLKEDGFAVKTVETAQEAFVALVNDVFDIFLLDMKPRSKTGASPSEDAVSVVRMIRQDRRILKSSLVVLVDRVDSLGIAQAVDAGVDGFIVKPLEKTPFLKDISRILEEAEFRRTGKKLIDVNHIHFLLRLIETECRLPDASTFSATEGRCAEPTVAAQPTAGSAQQVGVPTKPKIPLSESVGTKPEGGREVFFTLARIIFDKLILEKIKSVMGEPVIISVMSRLQNAMEQKGYVFMKHVCLSGLPDACPAGDGEQAGLKLSMEEVEKRCPDIPTEDLVAEFRHFVYTFLRMVHVLTSNILIGRPLEILLVEDNPGDVRLTEEALKDSAVSYRRTSVKDGLEAMDFLRRQGIYAQASLPDLILLDLNLPGKDGRQVLAEIKSDSFLRDIPVVIMTVCAQDEEVFRSQGLKFESYIVKPFDLNQFYRIIKVIENENFDALKRFLE